MRTPACWSWPLPAAPHDGTLPTLTAWQEDRCAICGDSSRNPGRTAHVLDHDHNTGFVRGWICRSCNIMEGNGKNIGGQFGMYRKRHPAALLGMTIRYSNRRPAVFDAPEIVTAGPARVGHYRQPGAPRTYCGRCLAPSEKPAAYTCRICEKAHARDQRENAAILH